MDVAQLDPATLAAVANHPPQTTMTRINIEYQDQFGHWHHYQTMHHEANAFRTAQQRARSTGKRYRLMDGNRHVLDIIEP